MGEFEDERLRAEVRARLFHRTAERSTIGPYQVSARLGVGAMGSVYRARTPDGRDVAIKLVERGHGQALARLRRESRALRELDHPHIVRIEDTGDIDEGAYVVMELVDGESLRSAITCRDPRLADARACLTMLLPVLDALAHAHGLGLLHRDVKPDNVLLGTGDIAKLADFGLATGEPGSAAAERESLGGKLTRTGAAVGTVGYAAPEQLLGQHVDQRADQFAACVTLWEALFGVLPFHGKSVDAIGLAAVAGRIDAPPHDRVPAPVVAILRRGLAPTPAARHADVRALASALRRAI
jgi:serine/threonine protein kinase